MGRAVVAAADWLSTAVKVPQKQETVHETVGRASRSPPRLGKGRFGVTDVIGRQCGEVAAHRTFWSSGFRTASSVRMCLPYPSSPLSYMTYGVPDVVLHSSAMAATTPQTAALGDSYLRSIVAFARHGPDCVGGHSRHFFSLFLICFIFSSLACGMAQPECCYIGH